MRKGLASVVCLTTALLLSPAGPGFAEGRGARPQGGHGAVQPRGSGHPGVRGDAGVAPRPTWHGGFRGPVVAPHRPAFHDGIRGHSRVETRVFIGSGFWSGPDWWGPGYPYYAEPPVIVPQEPPVYVQPEPQPQYYWYYCQNPPGYYPYVQQCPGGWMTVVPPAAPLGR